MARYISGFLKYPTNDQDIIDQASLTSSTELGSTGAIAGTGATFDSVRGFSTGDGAVVNFTPTAAQQARLDIHSYFHFEIENSFLNSGDGTQHRLIHTAKSGATMMASTDGNLSFSLDATYSELSQFLNATNRENTHTKFDVIMDNGRKRIYVDGLKLFDKICTPQTPNFSTFTIGGRLDALQPWYADHYFRNFIISDRIQSFGTHPDLSSLVICGDSISVQGNHTTGLPQLSGSAGSFKDHGWIPMVEKQLRNIGIEFSHHHYAANSAAMLELSGQVTNAITVNPTFAIIFIGTNDVGTGTLTANWETDYQTHIDRLTAAGCKKLVLVRIPSRNAYTLTNVESTVNEANAAIDRLVAANPECYAADVFNALGGHDIDPNDWISGNIHPQQTGQYKVGLAIGQAVMKALE